MADANRLRNPAPTPVDDDPFAELTRIMGFDPRIPVQAERAAAKQGSAARSDPEEDIDFAIDLEQELMGALAEPEPMQAANEQHAYASPFDAPQPVEYEPEKGQATQHASAYRSAEDEPAYQQSLDEEAYEPASDEQAYDSSDYRAHDYTQPEPSYAPTVEQGFDAVDEEDDRSEYALQHTGYEAAEAPAVQAYAQPAEDLDHAEDLNHDEDLDHADELTSDLDEALASSFGNEIARDQAQDEPEWASEPAYAGVAPAEATAPATEAGDEFAGTFDAAMAEVDMDFSKDPAADQWQPDSELAAVEEPVQDPQPYAALPAEQPPVEEEEFYQSADAGAPQDEDPALEEPEVGPEPATAEVAGPAAADTAERNSQSEIDDAIAELAAMVRGYERPVVAAQPAQPVAPPEPPQAEREEEFLEIDTVDVPEDAVALADDLDIPEFHEAAEPAPMFDDLDAELAAAFGEPNHEPAQPARAETASLPEFDLSAGYDHGAAAAAAGATTFASSVSAMALDRAAPPRGSDNIQIVRRDQQHAEPLPYDDSFDVEPYYEDEFELAGMPVEPQPRVSRRGLIVASVVGGIAVLGVVGALALSGGSGIGTGEPALVKADSDPIKIKPENPGGAVVANQESRVFDRAAGDTAVQPNQEQLVTTEEEPVDVATRFPEETPEPVDESADIEGLEAITPKGEDRIEQAIADDQPAANETVAVQPRKVRTMVVKPDGSLVPREETAPPVAQDIVGSTTTAAGALTDPAVSATTPAQAPAEQLPPAAEDTAAPAEAGESAATAPAAEPAPASRAAVPDTMPALPSRPADQPVDIVGEVKPDQVASIASNAAPAGAWSMQIASQPSEASAKSTYEDLSRRYGSVLNGRTANIVKADIAGKGTFWRVRVPAGSRNEAVSLCESYKSAGGNCFVSK
jgi:hypothetical protein